MQRERAAPIIIVADDDVEPKANIHVQKREERREQRRAAILARRMRWEAEQEAAREREQEQINRAEVRHNPRFVDTDSDNDSDDEPRAQPQRVQPRLDVESDEEDVRDADEEVVDNPVADIPVDDNADAQEAFWGIIARLQWRNRSDGVMTARHVQNVVGILPPARKNLFRAHYKYMYDRLNRVLELDGTVERNNGDASTIISHVIALGRDQYNTLSDDMELLQFLIITGECQSLDDMLPNDVKY